MPYRWFHPQTGLEQSVGVTARRLTEPSRRANIAATSDRRSGPACSSRPRLGGLQEVQTTAGQLDSFVPLWLGGRRAQWRCVGVGRTRGSRENECRYGAHKAATAQICALACRVHACSCPSVSRSCHISCGLAPLVGMSIKPAVYWQNLCKELRQFWGKCDSEMRFPPCTEGTKQAPTDVEAL